MKFHNRFVKNTTMSHPVKNRAYIKFYSSAQTHKKIWQFHQIQPNKDLLLIGKMSLQQSEKQDPVRHALKNSARIGNFRLKVLQNHHWDTIRTRCL